MIARSAMRSGSASVYAAEALDVQPSRDPATE
jgi:hypothetical protein